MSENEKGVGDGLGVVGLKRHSQIGDVLFRFRKHKVAVAGFFVVVLLAVVAAFAPALARYNPSAIDPVNALQFPSAEHWFGTDLFGRDTFSRILYGGRTSLLVALLGCLVSMVIGGTMGALAGYKGDKVDVALMRIIDIMVSVPGVLLAVCISALLGAGVWQTALAVSVGGIPQNALLLRSTIFGIRSQDYIEAAKTYGSRDLRVIVKHVLPNCMAPLIINVTLSLGANILMISGLSFIGLGVQPPTVEWGAMLNEGQTVIRQFWPMVVFPGMAIAISMLGFNLFGDGLRDALDPKQKH
ncbi:MAG: ABC transporter permease [Lachnospiraceae bacterium]|jgi:peptide/nickel transport system permease protein|nr:ABC transporter permease [Lachnospiraceae bacterium]